MMQWYEHLFKNYACQYENESYVTGTPGEVDFIEKEIKSDKTVGILDIGCGTGRHAIELAGRGYQLTAFDLSAAMLRKARANARQKGVHIDFYRKDARRFRFKKQFGLAIMLCEGSFPLMETDEMNFAILQHIFRALQPGGKLIFTTLNGLFPLFHSVKDFLNEHGNLGSSKVNTFDLMTFRDYSEFETTDDDGQTLHLQCNERYYVPSEINWLLSSAGFTNISIHGCTLGAYSRNEVLTPDHFEMLVIAEKP
ncbi:MAG: class I SAM-dependent methyltransferase [Bacteroidetes bacterium]|nr:class I SAM-dependent methyltransferase [Bacteroidota bacterium]